MADSSRLTRSATRIARRDWLAFGTVVLAVALPWYVLVCCRLPAFARHFLWEHNVLRFVAPFDHPRGVWFYAPVVLLGLLPGTLLLVPFVRFLLSGRDGAAWRAARSESAGR